MSEALPIWNCTPTEAMPEGKEPSTPLKSLTVGSKYRLDCKGDIPVTWGEGPVKLVPPKKEEDFKFNILKVEKLEANTASFVVTSYRAGKLEMEYLRFTQNHSGFEWTKPSIEIQSVLKKDQPNNPYPNYGPWSVGFPLWILVSVGVFLLLLALIVYRIVRRYTQRKRILEELARHTTALSPIHQFYRDARNLRRRLDKAKTPEEVKTILAELNKEFRLYILRQYQIPTLEWSDRAILEDLRKRHRFIFNEAADPLKLSLRELSRLNEQKEVKASDVEQLHRMSMNAAERIEAAEARKPRRRR